ncbi:MAG: DNA alkylation repair protein, partial [Patescibacteria group bacterium]
EEKNTASNLLGFSPEKRSAVSIKRIDTWLNELAGWSEIDSLCYNVFTGEELLHKWSLWEKFLHKLSLDTNLNKKRASLVFLAGAVSYSQDPRLLQLSFTLTERLKSHKEIIITKAISWLLRSMVKYHKKEVSKYIKENQNTLPKIAIRETTRKIQTGRK